MTFRVKIIDFFCKVFRLPRYSLYRSYSPIKAITSTDNRKGKLHVIVLKAGVDPVKYTAMFNQKANNLEIDLDATYIFVSDDFKDIRTIDPDELRVLGELCWSEDAQHSGPSKE